MRFIFLFISAISIQCYAASEAMELHYCETVKKAASGVMDARQHEVPAKELHDIANHLEEQQAKQTTLTMALFILVAGVVGSFIVGRPLSASTAGVAAA
ncbi:hypothetical protein, partial [Klebsiella pneumoniae]|uniref:hypothetical protein n=1 Tax=Klebsiella pneumoniae TaxID=573 RepID=UPI0037AD2891